MRRFTRVNLNSLKTFSQSRTFSSFYGLKNTVIQTNNSKNVQNKYLRNSTDLPLRNQLFNRRYYSSEINVPAPSMGESVSEGEVQTWEVAEGEYVNVDELVVSIETDKVQIDVNAPQSGVVVKHLVEEGDNVAVGQDMFVIDTSAAPPAGSAKPEATEAPAATEAAPAQPSGGAPPPPPPPPAAAETPAKKTPEKKTPAAAPSSTPSAQKSGSREETRVKMTKMRARIADRLKEAQNTNAMLTTFQECDMSGLMNLRAELGEEFLKKHGTKLGFMSAFVKASSKALEKMPVINAVIDGNEIVYRDYVDISVAVATPNGLVVPVLRNCESQSFADIEKNIVSLGERARDGKLAMEDMMGGTFTISNGGVYGSMMGTPIINPPQSAILGMHGIFKRPVAVGDKVEIRPMMYLALTYDHRLIDGREGVTFLRSIKHGVEDPRRLLLDL